VEVDTTPPSLVSSVLVGTSLDVTSGGDRVAILDTEHVDLITTKRTKKNPQKWVIKKCGSQVGELEHLKSKTIILYDDRDDKIHMTQPVGFVVVDLVSFDG